MAKLTLNDLVLLRDAAIRHYISIPSRSRFPDMNRDLVEEEKRSLSYFEASLELLNRMGLIKEMPNPNSLRLINYTTAHDIVDEDTEGVLPA